MNVLIIYSHPNHHSLCYAFLEKVLEGCKQNTAVTNVQVLDLYESGFDPVLVHNKEKRRRDMHRDPKLETYRQQILWADKIVMIYPIWWGRPPAMLLGYIDQIFASNFAYRETGKPLPEGLLVGKSAVCVSTMKGPTPYMRFWLNNAHKVLMKRSLFSYVGIKKVKFFEFANMESPNGKQKEKLNKVLQYFQGVRE